MTRQSGNYVDAEHLRQGSTRQLHVRRDGAAIDRRKRRRDRCDRRRPLRRVALQAGDVVSDVTFITGGTAAGSATAGFAALYSTASTPALLAQTADFGSTAHAANTAYTVTLATAQTITTAGIYYVHDPLHRVDHAHIARRDGRQRRGGLHHRLVSEDARAVAHGSSSVPPHRQRSRTPRTTAADPVPPRSPRRGGRRVRLNTDTAVAHRGDRRHLFGSSSPSSR